MATVRSTYANINNGRWELLYMYIYWGKKIKKKCKGYRQTNTIAIIKYIEGVYIYFLILFENSVRARGTHFCVCVCLHMNRSSIFFLILPYSKTARAGKAFAGGVRVVNTNIRYESLFLMKSAVKPSVNLEARNAHAWVIEKEKIRIPHKKIYMYTIEIIRVGQNSFFPPFEHNNI